MQGAKGFQVLLATMILSLPAVTWAKSPIERRLEQLERQVSNQFNVDTLNRIQELQQEVLELRGMVEEQNYQLETLKKSQQALYNDLDSRLKNNQQTAVVKPGNAGAVVAKTIGTTTKASEKELYQAAYQYIENKKFSQAATALQDFLWQFPEGEYAPNAHYWLGEVYLVTWRENKKDTLALEKATSAFKTVTKRYEKHHKANDSTLKLGLIEIEQGHWQAAKAHLTQLKQKYPNSSNARIAESKLQRLEQEGKI